MMLRLIYILIAGFFLCFSARAEEGRYASSSALAEGKWVKIRIDQTGIYKLSYAELRKMGFADPAKVSVHGYGGWPLEEDFTQPYLDDVPATAVWRGDDYLLFYGKGPVKWEYVSTSQSTINPENNTFVHTNNPYSLYGYYFLTDATEVPEMAVAPKAEGATLQVTNFDDYQVHEKDLSSLSESGRELFGESFELNLSQNFTFQVPGIQPGDAKVTLRFVALPTTSDGLVQLSSDGKELIRTGIQKITPEEQKNNIKGRAVLQTVTWPGEKQETTRFNILYAPGGHENVRLDYIRFQMQRALRPYGACTFFRSLASKGNATRFIVQGANAATRVFDVTDGRNPQVVETELNGAELTFTIPAGPLREFALVQTDQALPAPQTVGEVTPQNLHALPQTDMVILAPAAFHSEAERLAEEHRQRDGLHVTVIDPESVYNEFSSGTPDATAYRRLMKMFYDRKTSDADAPKYLLLFGDGVYDNRGVTAEIGKMARENMLLTYQSQESLTVYSYVTDDYFGFLDDNEGKQLASDKIDIGIGRLPVRTLTEAKNVVDKLIRYMDNQETGVWKNQVAFVADDGSTADTFTVTHMRQANTQADYIENHHPEFLVNKILFDAYKKDYSGHTTYPDVTKKIQKLLKSGLLLLNYTGHGNTQSWSDEKVWNQSDILKSTYTQLPLWITATCDFTRFDAPATSAGEDVLLHKISGGIALYTTTRAVYPSGNFQMNQKLIEHLFDKKDGHRLTLGEIMKQTKRDLGTQLNKLNFLLIGDPAMKLAYPEYRMRVTAVNGRPVDSSEPVVFQARAHITVEGEVLGPDGEVATDFTGVVNPTVMDSRTTVTTLDNNRTGQTFTYEDYLNTLFAGNGSVREGKFSFSFTVPKDISYSGNYGRMNLYAADETSGNEAQGAYLNFVVGGTAEDAEKDTEGPEIRQLYLNDSTFTDGGQVNTTPFFVAKVWDKNGINITGNGVGHDIILTIDNNPAFSYNLNSYYELLPDEEGIGLIGFAIPTLEPGLHTAEFKVWDVLNNSTTHTFTFEVVAGLKPFFSELVATPNPAREQVEFRLYHNLPETALQVGISVYDLAGRLVWTTHTEGSSERFKAYIVTWNLTDRAGSRLRPGLYIYRAAISQGGSKEATKANKLLILAQ